MRWPVRGFPLAPYLVSFPCFLLVSLQHPLVSSGNPGETPWNSSFWGGSEPCLRLFWGQNRQNTGYFAGIPGKPRYTWKIPGYRADFLNFAPDFAPDQLSDSGKLASFPRETREKQNGAPNTLWFPWKLPETQSAGDPLVSLWVAGNPRKGQRMSGCRQSAVCHPLGMTGRRTHLHPHRPEHRRLGQMTSARAARGEEKFFERGSCSHSCVGPLLWGRA